MERDGVAEGDRARAPGTRGNGLDFVSGVKGGHRRILAVELHDPIDVLKPLCGGWVVGAREWRQGGQRGGCYIEDAQTSAWHIASTHEMLADFNWRL